MTQYTYRLSRENVEKPRTGKAYRLEELQAMTTYQLREICQKERLAVPMGTRMEKEELIRFIMRYRGIREYRHITESAPDGLEAVQSFLNRVELKEDSTVRIAFPSNLILYEGEGIELTDHYEVGGTQKLYEGNLLLVDEALTVYTCLYLKEIQKRGFFLLKGRDVPIVNTEGHQYFLLYFPRAEVSEILYDLYHGRDISIPKQAICVKTPLLAVDIRQTEETRLPLIIDFGSSNTTLGMYCADGTTQIVKAVDEGPGGLTETPMIPSVVGVRGIKDGKTEFAFGYEARKMAENAYPDEDCPVFYDIKRWVSAPDRLQQVVTAEGAKLSVCRKDVLSAFLHYLIDTARQQFKCRFTRIQLLVPVRQKERFGTLFEEILPEYHVSCSLDEGMAVLFYSIQELILTGKYEEGAWYQALVMDCGGGTTDLTSGRFCIRNNRVSYEVDLETGYENGDTNFGGNNLTFRLLELLKVRLLEAMGYPGFTFDMENGQDTQGMLYERLGQLYEAAEHVMPTRFLEYENRGREEYFRVKNNYYHLFCAAENIKESFFQKSFRYVLSVNAGGQGKEGVSLDKWRLSVWEGGQLQSLKKDVSFDLYLYEIENLLRPDIYGLMGRFLERPFAEGELSEYSMLKLTGQSCKSALFLEALKEYVPGRLIKSSRDSGKEGELKMCCLEGAISYFKNRKLGYMKVNQSYQVNALPYEVTAFTHENKEKVLIHSLQKGQDIGYISRFMVGEQMDFYLHDEKGKNLKAYHFSYDVSHFAHVTQEAIDEKYAGTVIQEQTDIIQDGETKFFVWPARGKWGFLALPVLREDGMLKQGEETFFAFEDDTWEENFFDGRK